MEIPTLADAHARIALLEAALAQSDAQLLAHVDRAADTRDNLVRLKEALKRKRAEVETLTTENRELRQQLVDQELQHIAFVEGLHDAYDRVLRVWGASLPSAEPPSWVCLEPGCRMMHDVGSNFCTEHRPTRLDHA
jgi:hypothetical protein